MTRLTSTFSLLALVVALFGLDATALAQPRQGDLVIGREGSTAAILYARPTLGVASTLHTWSSGGIDGIQVDHANGAVLAARSPRDIIRITAAGVSSTLRTLLATDFGPTRMAIGQDGHVLVTRWTRTPNEALILRMAVDGSSVTTLTTLARTLFDGLVADPESGQFAALTDRNQLLELDPATGSLNTMTTLAGRFGDHADVCYLPDRDIFAVVESGLAGPPSLLLVTRTGSVTARTPLGLGRYSAFCITYDDRAGMIYVGTGNGQVLALNSSGVIVSSRNYGPGVVRSLDIWDDRNIALDTTGRPGASLVIRVSFLESAGRSYCLAASTGLRPGFVFGGRRLNLAPDALFFATACQFPGFAGVLSAAGRATVNLRVPSLPVGFRIYLAGVAVKPALPGGLDVGNTECLRIR